MKDISTGQIRNSPHGQTHATFSLIRTTGIDCGFFPVKNSDDFLDFFFFFCQMVFFILLFN